MHTSSMFLCMSIQGKTTFPHESTILRCGVGENPIARAKLVLIMGLGSFMDTTVASPLTGIGCLGSPFPSRAPPWAQCRICRRS